MPKVTVKYLVNLRERTGKATEEMELPENARLSDIADKIHALYGIKLPDPHIIATLNGKGWGQYPEGMRTPVGEQDLVLLFPPLSGG